MPYAYIAAAIARAKPEKNGSLGIGEAIAKSYDDGKESDPAKAKLRRLLACENKKEACQVLRPLLSLIASRGVNPDYASLLNDLIYFNQQTKRKWAESFYGRKQAEENNNE